jgi:hypothetical protein
MKDFMTTQAKILEVSGLQPTYDPSIVIRDLERTQIPGELFMPDASQDSETTLPHLDSKLVVEREEFNQFFQIFFRRPPETHATANAESVDSASTSLASQDSASTILEGKTDSEASSQTSEAASLELLERDFPIYNQGMLTGSIVDTILLKSFTHDEVVEWRTNTAAVSFCFKAENDTWQGVHLRVNLKTYQWYAVVTDFTDSQAQVAIMGNGDDYTRLSNTLDIPELTETYSPHKFIKNNSVRCAIGQLSMEAAFVELKGASALTTYSRCILKFLVTCGCLNYATFLQNNPIFIEKLQNLDATYETPKLDK